MTESAFDETKLSTRLPNLNVEVVHRRAWQGDAEEVSITLRGMPCLDAFGRFVEATNPFALWLRLMQTAWTPWLGGFGEVTQATRISRPAGAAGKLQAPALR